MHYLKKSTITLTDIPEDQPRKEIYEYNRRGEVIRYTDRFGGIVNYLKDAKDSTGETTYEFNENGTLARSTAYSEGDNRTIVVNEYDLMGHLISQITEYDDVSVVTGAQGDVTEKRRVRQVVTYQYELDRTTGVLKATYERRTLQVASYQGADGKQKRTSR